MQASRIYSAVSREFVARGFACLAEFSLKTNRRPDMACLGKDGTIILIEIKSSAIDFKTDQKWQDYCEWADSFYFAVGDDFPLEILPGPTDCGIIITDGFDCHIVREAPVKKLAGARRNHLIRRLARASMLRLHHRLEEEGAQ